MKTIKVTLSDRYCRLLVSRLCRDLNITLNDKAYTTAAAMFKDGKDVAIIEAYAKHNTQN